MRRLSSMISTGTGTLLAALWAGFVLIGCASGPPQFSDSDVVWQVNDQRPIEKPKSRWTPKYWDAVDATLFRPLTRAFRLETPEPAKNVNAWGHVPNSSWYTNRFSTHSITPDRVARGPCESTDMPRGDEWVIKGGKVGGNNPGFIIEVHQEDGSTTNYLLKFDGELQTERATAADVIGSKVYWAAGFEAPCNRVVYFDSDRLVIGDDATKEDRVGRETPLTREDVKKAMKHTPRLDDGRVRAVASKFLPGEPLGPFSYEGTRRDDPNDVIPHEDRRELRGSKVIAAWLNHFDAREQNTYTSFISGPPSQKGYVQHFMLDFGDCLGSRWPSDGMSRRFGYSWYVDGADMLVDFMTLGIVPRPWHKVRTYSEAPIFGYYDVKHFQPETWKAGYPNMAFRHMDDRDAFWATNIISRFSQEHIRHLVEAAKFTKSSYDRYLERVLVGRRNKIVEHYFRQMSPLVDPRVRGSVLCVDDAWVARGYGAVDDAFYDVKFRSTRTEGDTSWENLGRPSNSQGRLCVDLPSDAATQAGRGDLVVHLRVRRTDQRDPARDARFYLRADDTGSWRVVGITRVGDRP